MDTEQAERPLQHEMGERAWEYLVKENTRWPSSRLPAPDYYTLRVGRWPGA